MQDDFVQPADCTSKGAAEGCGEVQELRAVGPDVVEGEEADACSAQHGGGAGFDVLEACFIVRFSGEGEICAFHRKRGCTC